MNWSNQAIPRWIRVVAVLLGLFGVGIGLAGYFTADAVVAGFVADSPANNTMAMMFSGRNLAVGIALLLVALRGSPAEFALIFMIRLLTELQDGLAKLANLSDPAATLPEIGFIAVLIVVEIYIIRRMLSLQNAQPKGT
jgi:hypothetical protein